MQEQGYAVLRLHHEDNEEYGAMIAGAACKKAARGLHHHVGQGWGIWLISVHASAVPATSSTRRPRFEQPSPAWQLPFLNCSRHTAAARRPPSLPVLLALLRQGHQPLGGQPSTPLTGAELGSGTSRPRWREDAGGRGSEASQECKGSQQTAEVRFRL